jgi:hypothetical protein
MTCRWLRKRERDDQMAPLSTAYMHAMHIWRHRWMNSGRGRAVPIKPINATDGRSSRPEHNLLNVPLHLLRSGLHHIHCFPLKLSTVHLLPLYLNLASRFQVTVHHYNAFHYHTVHSTSSVQKKNATTCCVSIKVVYV